MGKAREALGLLCQRCTVLQEDPTSSLDEVLFGAMLLFSDGLESQARQRLGLWKLCPMCCLLSLPCSRLALCSRIPLCLVFSPRMLIRTSSRPSKSKADCSSLAPSATTILSAGGKLGRGTGTVFWQPEGGLPFLPQSSSSVMGS